MSAIAEFEFEVDGQQYRSRRMDAFNQQTVASKLGGVLMLMADMKAADGKSEPDASAFTRAFCALSGDMRKSDSDMVMGLCLDGISRKQPGDTGWAPIRVGGGLIAFDDINLNEMLLIVWQVLKQHRIPDFFSAPPSISNKPKVGAE